MIMLQILMIPIVVVLLLSTVFIIGSLGLEVPRYPTRNDLPDIKVDDPDLTLPADSSLPNYPILWF